MEGSVFYLDIYNLLLTKYLPPRDRYSLIKTCKKLYSLYTPYERRMLFAGAEPIVKAYDHPDFKECPICKMFVKKFKYVKHFNKCTTVVEKRKICIDCLELEGYNHVCNSNKRCEKCYRWSITGGGYSHFCMLKSHKCSCGGLHFFGQFLKYCEICGGKLDKLSCPFDIPRCTKHPLFICNVCGEKGEATHKCSTLLNRLKFKYGKDTEQIEDNVYQNQEYTIVIVQDIYSIPSLLSYKNHVFILVGENVVMNYYSNGIIEWRIFDLPKQCIKCAKTQDIRFKCCYVNYCGVECQKLDWKNHKARYH